MSNADSLVKKNATHSEGGTEEVARVEVLQNAFCYLKVLSYGHSPALLKEADKRYL